MTLTILTPSFRQLPWLRLCIASVQDQLGSGDDPTLDVEHVIQDGGSPDIETFAREVGAEFHRDGQCVLSAPSTNPPRVRLVIHSEPDSGMYDAINRGLAKSSGEICAWLNCDEQYLPGTLARVAELFRRDPKMDVLLGDAILTNSHHRPLSYRRIMVPSRWHTRLDHLHSLSCAMFFRRSALPSPPLDPQWKVIGDAVLMDHFLSSGKRVVACKQPLAAYAFTGSNLSANPSHGEHERWLAMDGGLPEWARLARFGVVGMHRLRRLWHGAYGAFEVDSGLYTADSGQVRKRMAARLRGRWPGKGAGVS